MHIVTYINSESIVCVENKAVVGKTESQGTYQL